MRHVFIVLFLVNGLVTVLAITVIKVDGEYRHTGDASDSHFQRRREAALRYNRRHHNVILAPLEGRSVITKERMYVNAMEERDDQIYQQLLVDPKASVDSFFVTEPPLRTKMTERTEPVEVTTPMTPEPSTLRLVTLPKLVTSPPPPFKHTTRNPTDLLGLPQLPQFDVGHSQVVRFPAQSWQIPPRDPQKHYNPWEHLFEPPKLFPGLQPTNPFLPSPPLQNSTTSNPFIPIGVSNPTPFTPFPNYPPPQPLQPPPVPFEPPMVHKSPLRSSGSAKMAHVAAIPLPSDPADFGNDRLPKSVPGIPDFSIDSPSTEFAKDEDYIHGHQPKKFISSSVRSLIIEGGSDQLKNFAKHHPNIMNQGRRPPPAIKESQLVLPKSLQSNTRPIVPIIPSAPPTAATSTLSPNQKLYLCCQKQQVSLSCQGMCNFDTFSDKTLVSAFLTNQCPGPQLGKAYDCASSKADHSSCCERNGLLNFQGGRCLPFCRTHVATPANIFDYLPCLQVFETIKYCYREYQLNHKNIFGD